MKSEAVNPKDEGWAFPGTSRKVHFMRDGRSLCNKWGFYRGPLGLPVCRKCKEWPLVLVHNQTGTMVRKGEQLPPAGGKA